MSKVKSSGDAKKLQGRPRSEAARRAVLDAARALLEEVGVAGLTIEAVAARAGVGKPTIYRSWANAQELAMAALIDQRPPAVQNAASAATHLDAFESLILSIVDRLNSREGRQMTMMLAASESDSELFKAFRNRVILDGREKGRFFLEAARTAGELDPTAEPAHLVDLVLGFVFFRLLLKHERLDKHSVKHALAIVLSGVAVGR